MLHEILVNLRDGLQKKVQTRDEISQLTKRIIYLSKHSIMAVHREAMEEARSKLKQMAALRMELDQWLCADPEMITGSVRVAYQEYAEAHILFSVVETGDYPDPAILNVSATSYLLGLADVVGEFRRRALTHLLQGSLRDAEKCLRIMEEIYSELIAQEEAYILAPELRRKCDIARRIIESTLGDIVMESRREVLQKTIESLEKALTRDSP